MRSGKPDPLRADVVHVREDGRDRAHLPGRLCCPCRRIEMFDQNLVHPIVRGKDTDGVLTELRGNLVLPDAIVAHHGGLRLCSSGALTPCRFYPKHYALQKILPRAPTSSASPASSSRSTPRGHT